MTEYPAAKMASLETSLASAAQLYYRLVLLVGPIGSGKTPLLKELSRKQNIPYLNLNLALSQLLLDLTSRERPLRVLGLIEDLLAEYPGNAIILDNIELLFDPALQLSPLALLQRLSRQRTLVVSWGGTYDTERHALGYAEPGHPEYRRYEHPEGLLIALP